MSLSVNLKIKNDTENETTPKNIYFFKKITKLYQRAM